MPSFLDVTTCPNACCSALVNGVEVHNFSSSGYITRSFVSHPDSVNIVANVLRHLITSRKEGITKSSSFSHKSPSHDQFAALKRTSSCAVINSTVNREAIPQVLPNSTQSLVNSAVLSILKEGQLLCWLESVPLQVSSGGPRISMENNVKTLLYLCELRKLMADMY